MPNRDSSSLFALEMEFLGMNKKHIRAAGYPRVSDPNKKDSVTIESQEADIRRHIERQGYELTEDHIYPEAMTAYMLPFRDRPVFMKLIEAAKRGEFDVLVVSEYSRLARKQVEQAVIIDLLQKYGVKIESVTEDFDDSAIGNFMRSTYAFLAEVEREKTYYRTNRGRKDRATNNLTGQGIPKYGYEYADNEHGYRKARYLIKQEIIATTSDGVQWTEANVVQYIHEAIQQGRSLRNVALGLTEMGIPTCRKKDFWSVTAVSGIATDRWYTGKDLTTFNYKRQMDTVTKKSLATKRPEEERIKIPDGIVPPIISVECWQATQEALQRNKQFSGRNNSHPKGVGILRCGLAKCGICGYTMQVLHLYRSYKGQTKIPVPPKYSCTRKMGSNKLQHHHSVTIMTHILDDQAWDLAKTYIKNPVLVRERVMQILEESKPHEAAEDIKKSIEAINKKISNLITLAEDIDDDEKLADIRVRVTELQKQRKQANTMFHHAEEEETFQEELEKELGRFEEWAQKVQPLLEQEDFKPTHEEMQKACVILGITVKVYPEKAENRVEFSIAPPSIFKVLCTQLPDLFI